MSLLLLQIGEEHLSVVAERCVCSNLRHSGQAVGRCVALRLGVGGNLLLSLREQCVRSFEATSHRMSRFRRDFAEVGAESSIRWFHRGLCLRMLQPCRHIHNDTSHFELAEK